MHNNHSTLIFLMNEQVRAIAVTYEKIDMDQDTTKMKYNAEYLSAGRLPKGAVIFKTMDPDIKVDDFVIVPTDTRHGMTVCKVVAVDIEIDYSSEDLCHWIVGTVDTTEFERLRQAEDQMIQMVKRGKADEERAKARDQMMAGMKNVDLAAIPMFSKSDDDNGEEATEETTD